MGPHCRILTKILFVFDFEFWVFLLNFVLFGGEVARAEHRCEGMGMGKSGIGCMM